MTLTRKIGGDSAQALAPDHDAQLGTSGAELTVVNADTVESAAAPKRGIVVISIPAGLTVRIRIGNAVTASENDQAYFGGSIWHFPILGGERVSLYGDGSGGTVTVSMAR